jgi:glycosyltransferase involved in cell wall biosynthesis
VKLRVAIVHDYLVDSGGAERVVIALHEQFPDAPIFTSVIDPQTTFHVFNSMDVRTSFLQRLPVRKSNYKLLLPFYPLAFESFDLSNYDLVISSASAFAKSVITSAETLHICYCYTPARFAWRFHEYVAQEHMGRVKQVMVQCIVHYLRQWDYVAAQRVDEFVSVSKNTQRRIQKNYRRESTVIYPPIVLDEFMPNPEIGDYYLIVSRLAPYKRIDLAIQAFNDLGLTLKIVGAGSDAARLRQMAKSNIQFLGHVPQKTLSDLYAHCRAVIFPGVEDFGLVPLEANAAGRPVVAFALGGALETVRDGVTGVFFSEPSASALADVVRATDVHQFDRSVLRAHAAQFDPAHFQTQMMQFIQAKARAFGLSLA